MKKNELLFTYRLLKARLLKKRIPLIIGWSLTNRCNLKCLYCIRWKCVNKELSTGQICSIIDELAVMGAQSINFTGGESLIREDIGEIISYTKSKNINTGLSSNGILVPLKIEEIKKADSLTLSFDGDEDSHDIQRNKGSYIRVLQAIQTARENNLPVRLHTVLTKNNTGSVEFILKSAERWGIVVNFSIVEFDPFSEREIIQSLFPPIEDLKSAINRLIVEKRNGNKNIGNSLNGLKYLYNWPDYKRINCCAGIIYCRIEPNGDIYSCANLTNRVNPQNPEHQGVKDAVDRLQTGGCKSCWCSSHIEMNYIYAFCLDAILNAKSKYCL